LLSLFEPLRHPGVPGAPGLMEWEDNPDAREELVNHDSRKLQHPLPVVHSRTDGSPDFRPAAPQTPESAKRVQPSAFRPVEPQLDPVRPQMRPAMQALQQPPRQTPPRESPLAAMPGQVDRGAIPAAPKILPVEPVRHERPTPRLDSSPSAPDRNLPLAKSPSAIEPRVTSRPEDPRRGDSSRRSEARSPASETVVNVTIGRIEVKAAAQQSPPAKGPSASPVMLLDEYLRQKRAGG
jgi:hypothetical protein